VLFEGTDLIVAESDVEGSRGVGEVLVVVVRPLDWSGRLGVAS
jgi:hypothetical protein